VFLQFLYDLSDRQVEEQVNLHLACKWFVGLQPEEIAPDHTALCRVRAGLGPDKFDEIFNRIVAQAGEVGVVHDWLCIIDATHLAAENANLASRKKSRVAAGAQSRFAEDNHRSTDCLYGGQLHTDDVCPQADGQAAGDGDGPTERWTVPQCKRREVK
jgi:hypothetical protein